MSSTALLLTALVCPVVLASAWEDRLHPDDRHSIQQAHATARSTLDSIGPEGYGHEEVVGIAALLDARVMARPTDRLLGDWRCRSIQLGESDLFSC